MERVRPRREVDDHVSEIGVATKASHPRQAIRVGGGHQGRSRPEAEPGHGDRCAPATEIGERGSDLVDLAPAQAEAREAVEVGGHDDVPVPREEPGESHQLGMAVSRR